MTTQRIEPPVHVGPSDPVCAHCKKVHTVAYEWIFCLTMGYHGLRIRLEEMSNALMAREDPTAGGALEAGPLTVRDIKGR